MSEKRYYIEGALGCDAAPSASPVTLLEQRAWEATKVFAGIANSDGQYMFEDDACARLGWNLAKAFIAEAERQGKGGGE